jgi:hypothetical protein
MRPRERRESGEQDLFRARLDQVIDMEQPPGRSVAKLTMGRFPNVKSRGHAT